MSIGIGANARLILEDENTVMYVYNSYNINHPKYSKTEDHCDGSILIQKRCFIQPIIHEKIKKMPRGRKKTVTKRIPVDVDYEQMINDGFITVENCSNCWETTPDEKHIDVMVMHLLFYIFLKYQKENTIPEQISYNI